MFPVFILATLCPKRHVLSHLYIFACITLPHLEFHLPNLFPIQLIAGIQKSVRSFLATSHCWCPRCCVLHLLWEQSTLSALKLGIKSRKVCTALILASHYWFWMLVLIFSLRQSVPSWFRKGSHLHTPCSCPGNTLSQQSRTLKSSLKEENYCARLHTRFLQHTLRRAFCTHRTRMSMTWPKCGRKPEERERQPLQWCRPDSGCCLGTFSRFPPWLFSAINLETGWFTWRVICLDLNAEFKRTSL